MISLTVAKAKRDNLFTQIQAIYDLTKKISDPDILQQLLIRAKSLDRLRQEFSDTLDLCHELEIKEDDQYIPNYAALSSVNELVDHIHATVANIEGKRQAAKSKHESSLIHAPTQLNVRLPKLELPPFTGDPISWVSFINLFNSSIHNNVSLSAVMKFQYLLSVVSGEPLTLIKSLPISDTNYKVAYDLLQSRYHSPRRLVTLHISKLLDLPSINYKPTPMRSFVDAYNENIQALKGLGTDISTNNPLLSTLILRKLDPVLRKRFEHDYVPPDTNAPIIPEVEDIIKFLDRECTESEAATLTSDSNHLTHKEKSDQSRKANFSSKKVSMVSTTVDPVPQPLPSSSKLPPCFVCSKHDHKIYFCPTFKSKTPNERYTMVKTLNRCVSCLGNHDLKMCQSKKTCQTCNKRHHTLLHFPVSKPVTSQTETASPFTPHIPTPNVTTQTSRNVLSSSVATASRGNHSPSQDDNYTVLLGTALIKLKGPEGNEHVFRALLDSGSMCNLITEHAAQLLNTQRYKSMVNLCGLSQNMTENKGQIFANLETLAGETLAYHQPLVVLERITVDLPRMPISPEVFRRTHQFVLADPTFHVPNRVDIVIGSAHFSQLLTGNIHTLGDKMPQAVGTRLGYVIMGSAPCATPSHTLSVSNASITMLSTTDIDLHTSLQRFWQQEELPQFNKKTEEEDQCDQHFEETHTRDIDGRYIVELPFKTKPQPVLGTSKLMAERRFKSLENKFLSQPQFRELYCQFMDDYISLGHMSKLDSFDESSPHYFLPHHGVLKTNTIVPKLRTVFDASSKTSNGTSLNDCLLTGRKLQTNICDILIHFRIHNVVFTCDIRQMYRQIKVHPGHQNFQLILWRDSPSKQPEIYKLNTVTYGMNSSPYLAIRTLHQLADDEGKDFPKAAAILKTKTYVDDIITGGDTVEEAQELQRQLIGLLQRGCFELRKWSSSSSLLLQNVPKDHLEPPVFLENSQQPHVSVLGLNWSPTSDNFSYQLNLPEGPPTKRSVLSAIARIYDPCGFLAPFTMLAKCFMQLLWASGLNWDDPLPPELASKWQIFISASKHISNIEIPRAFQLSPSSHLELHGFSDASESGYSAVLYLRIQTHNEKVTIRQILAKTRVAPLKHVTLPRLELCGAHLLAQLVTYVLNIFKERLNLSNTHLWCDSSVVLTWLQTPSYKLKTYVANRVAQTQESIPQSCWHHIKSQENPADCASRGILASHLKDHNLWWNGPEWLLLPQENWPTQVFPKPDNTKIEEESKPIPLSVLVATPPAEWNFLLKFSSWTKLKFVMAFVLRFIQNCKAAQKITGFITTYELDTAESKIIKIVQTTAFAEDINSLNKNQECSLKLRRLNPFIDSLGVLRVGGRLSKASLPCNATHPILLPKQSHVTNLIVDHYHHKHLHSGPQLTQGLISQTFWILSARSVIRSRIFKCITCFKVKPTNNFPLMGDLPAARVTPARPFNSTGVDYCGPFTVKVVNLRSARHIKVYICVFICTVTKAVHLEVATDLSTEAFITALTRFVARRGLCSDIYSDCGTNFVGADGAFRKIIKSTLHSPDAQHKITRFSVPQGIKFHFNPPAAPHQGGLWESAVKSAKHHLRRVMGETVLTLMDFTTLIVQIEAMLNSRPLTPMSSDPSDLRALTPGHFLIGDNLMSLPQNDYTDQSINRLTRWHRIQAIYQHIWQRWQIEYLHTLQQRSKWTESTQNLKVGDLVLVHSNTSPLTWPLARIIAVHQGSDGVVRVVDLKTVTGNLTRPAVKVFPLPLN